LPTIPTDQFISSFNNSTGHWTLKTFSVNTATCPAGQKVSAINNVTGHVTCTVEVGDEIGTQGGGVYKKTATTSPDQRIHLNFGGGTVLTSTLSCDSSTDRALAGGWTADILTEAWVMVKSERGSNAHQWNFQAHQGLSTSHITVTPSITCLDLTPP
jgi:hypothetical protein